MFSSLLNWNKQRFRTVDHRQLAKLDRLLTEVFLSCNHWWRFEWWWQQEDNITMANMIMMSKGHVSASVNRADWNRDDLHCAQWTHWRSSDHLPPDYKVKFYQIILQPQQKTAPHLVQNAVFTQTGGGSGNNHHHLRHHNQHHITIIIKRCIVPATPVSGSCLQIPLNWQGGGKRFF